MSVSKIKKRNGHVVAFDESKIQDAVYKAFLDSNMSEPDKKAQEIKELTLAYLEHYKDGIDIEHIQNLIEYVLLEEKYVETARHFIKYREEKRKLREEKKTLLQCKELDEVSKSFDLNQLTVLVQRYLLRNLDTGAIIETPSELFRRVATLVGLSDLLHDPSIFRKTESSNDFPTIRCPPYDNFCITLKDRHVNEFHYERFYNLFQELDNRGQMRVSFVELMKDHFKTLFDQKYNLVIEEYYQLMAQCYFMPNTPTLMNAGTSNGGLSACFVLDAPDSIHGYLATTVVDAAEIFRNGGGVGVNYSEFRPEGCSANGIPNASSGPCSFIAMINTLTDVVKSGGKRRGANMAVLNIHHPDIEKFITMKTVPGVYENFNVSVGIWGDYWEALTTGAKEFLLHHDTHHEKDRIVDPQKIWDLVAHSAWKSAEPGVLFFDIVNMFNPFKNHYKIGPIRTTNPCAEQGLEINGSCTLGSINLAKFVDPETKKFDRVNFAKVVKITTRFLDNVLDMNKYPTEDIKQMAMDMRRIGLGIMGLADALFMMEIPYNSKEGFEFMQMVCHQLTSKSVEESIELARERGPYNFYQEEHGYAALEYGRTRGLLGVSEHHAGQMEVTGLRNSWNTTIAPTGTISMISGCSGGCEPDFAMAFEKKVTIGRFFYKNKYLERELKKRGIYSEELIAKIADHGGSVQNILEIPEDMRKVYVTAMDIHWADHVMAQSVCQTYIDNSISKTINMAAGVLVEDVKNAYLLAHELYCKGLSIYRDGSRNEQVLHTNSNVTGKQAAPSEYTLESIKNLPNEYVRNKLAYLIPQPDLLGISCKDKFRNEELYVNVDSGQTFVGFDKGCPVCKSLTIYKEGCEKCSDPFCGWAACSSA